MNSEDKVVLWNLVLDALTSVKFFELIYEAEFLPQAFFNDNNPGDFGALVNFISTRILRSLSSSKFFCRSPQSIVDRGDVRRFLSFIVGKSAMFGRLSEHPARHASHSFQVSISLILFSRSLPCIS